MDIILNVNESNGKDVWTAIGIIGKYADSYEGISFIKDEDTGETKMLELNFNPKRTLGGKNRIEARIMRKLNKLDVF